MPGTGKTTTICGLVRLLVKLGQSVLIVAYTNSAVDTILCKLQAAGQPFLRLGRAERVRPELRDSTAEVVAGRAGGAGELAALYRAQQVVAATCLGVDHAATVGRQFDWVVCDEASQALLPSLLAPLLLAARFLLVGDHAQLPPTVSSSEARKAGLDQSLFRLLDSAHPEATLNLATQYRMNERITALANHLTYEGLLECGDSGTRYRVLPGPDGGLEPAWLAACLAPALERSVIMLDTAATAPEEREAGGILNRGEARAAARLVRGLLDRGLQQQDIGVIAPYSAQVKQLSRAVTGRWPGVEVGTVDQFQGRDKTAILYSCTRSGRDLAEGAGLLLLDTRRLNVAVTRARAKLVIIGHRTDLLRDYQPFRTIDSFFLPEDVVQLSRADLAELE